MRHYDQSFPTKKVHYVGTSAVITIDQTHVKRLNLDDSSFFIQKPVPNGILLEKRVLGVEVYPENDMMKNTGLDGEGIRNLEGKPETLPKQG
jgi:hypothetical protein